MKKIIVFALLLIIATTTFSQPTTKPAPAFKTDYLKKSNHQKTAAMIMLFGGVTLVVAPLIIFPKLKTGGDATWGIFQALEIVGIISIPTSIPFFIASWQNKEKALRLSFKNETVPQQQNNSFINRPVPSLSLKISL